MVKTQLTCKNDRGKPIYVFVELTTDCFELDPGQTLEVIFDAADQSRPLEIEVTEEGVTLWPSNTGSIDYLIDGEPANERSHDFRHKD